MIAPKASTPVVSIIIAAYGQEKYLAETLQSLIGQTFPEWEAIVVDDGSPDNVNAVAHEFGKRDGRIRFYHTENHGVSAARNFGASQAAGSFLLFLDGDDRIAPEYLEECLRAFKENNNVRAVYSQWQFFGSDVPTPPLSYQGYREELIGNSIHITSMIRRSEFEVAGGFDESMHTALEDWEFWIRFLNGNQADEVHFIRKPLFYYRQRPDSRNVSTHNPAKWMECLAYIRSKNHEIYAKEFGVNAPDASVIQQVDYEIYSLMLRLAGASADGDDSLASRYLDQLINMARNVARDTAIPYTSRKQAIHAISLMSGKHISLYSMLSAKQARRLRTLCTNPARFSIQMAIGGIIKRMLRGNRTHFTHKNHSVSNPS